MKNASQLTQLQPVKKKISYCVILIHFTFILYICTSSVVKSSRKKEPLIVRTKTVMPSPTIQPKSTNQTDTSNAVEKKHLAQAPKKPMPSIAKTEVKPASTKSQEKKTTQKPKDSKPISPRQNQSTSSDTAIEIPEELLKNLEQKLSRLEGIKEKPSKKTAIIVPDKIDPISASKYSRLDPFDLDDDVDSYPEYLAYFLKQELKLPDFGQVKVEITLNKAGCVEKCLVISSQSAKNKKYLEEKLPNLIFPKFKKSNHSYDTQQFVLTFCNEF